MLINVSNNYKKSYADNPREVAQQHRQADVDAVAATELLPTIRKKERDDMGMIEYDKQEELSFIKGLVYGE